MSFSCGASCGNVSPPGGDAVPAPIVLLAQVEWDFVWVFSQDLAVFLAGRGHPVVYVNPFPKRFPRLNEWRRLLHRLRCKRPTPTPLPPGVRVVNPLVFPDVFSWLTRFNRRFLLPRLARHIQALLPDSVLPLVFNFLPFATPMALADLLNPAFRIYACRSGWSDEIPPGRRGNREPALLQAAHVILTSSPVLSRRHRRFGEKIVEIPAMVDFPLFFRQPRPAAPAPEPIRCCFFGHVNERIDVELLRAVAAEFPLDVVGRVSVEWTTRPGEQFHFHGLVPHDELPALIAQADVFVFPYRRDAFTANIFPYKIYECFAMGRPVVATPLPALDEVGDLVYRAAAADEFLDAVRRAADEAPHLAKRRQELARRHDRQAVLGAIAERIPAWLEQTPSP